MRKFTTPKEWSDHLDAQLASDKTVKSYCHDNGFNLSSFYRQRRKPGKNRTSGEPQAFVLAPALQAPKVSGSSLSIRVKDFHLTLEPGYGPDDLEGVLVTLAKVRHVLRPE